MTGTCTKCQKRPIQVKKWALCVACYNRMYRLGQVGGHPAQGGRWMDEAHMEFASKHQQSGWIYRPAIFILPDDKRYIPSFWDAKRQAFLQIVDLEAGKGIPEICHRFRATYQKLPLVFVDRENREIPWEGLE